MPRENLDQHRQEARRRRRRLLLFAIGLLYLLSVPWYRSASEGLSILWGLPDWVTVAVACYALVAILNSVAWRLTDIDDRGVLPLTLSDPSQDPSDEEPS